MAGKEPPAFQEYARDFIADTQELTSAARGALHMLRCHFWLRGSLPLESNALARLGGVTAGEMKRIWPAIAHWFAPAPGGKVLLEPRLVDQRKALDEYRDKQRNKAKSKWAKVAAASAVALPVDNPRECSASAPSTAQIVDPDHVLDNVARAPGPPPRRVSEIGLGPIWKAKTGHSIGYGAPATRQVAELLDHWLAEHPEHPDANKPMVIAERAVEFFSTICDSFSVGYRPPKTPLKFRDHWPRVESMLNGAKLEAARDIGARGPTIVANLDFATDNQVDPNEEIP